ncbi:hypothetical protein E2005C_043 [Pseudomonas phage E2005-C]|nr:hypothetical protein E2005C_043 [Pseudomonas phage E2005-C]
MAVIWKSYCREALTEPVPNFRFSRMLQKYIAWEIRSNVPIEFIYKQRYNITSIYML